MRAGRLRHKIIVQEREKTKNLLGADSDNWIDLATLWCSIEPLGVKDYLSSDAQAAEFHGKIVMRYNPIIRSDHRILHQGQILEIQGQPINVAMRNRETHIMFINRGLK